MLEDDGGLPADRFDVAVGGRVLLREFGQAHAWHVVLRVNRAGGRISSVRTTRRYVPVVGIEEVIDYRAPAAEDVEKVRQATKLPPLCNFPGEGFLEMTQADWQRMPKDFRQTRTVAASEQRGAYRHRQAFVRGSSYRLAQVFIVDAKRVDPPKPSARPTSPLQPEPARPPTSTKASPPAAAAMPAAFDAMKAQLRAGVSVVVAPQLFPTPAGLADRMMDLAELEPGHVVLEPSAGTGSLLRALEQTRVPCTVVAVEIDAALAASLARAFPDVSVRRADFLECADDLGSFDRIIMNPPFAGADDVRHILRARDLLRPGGRIVALCAAGPRQEQALRPIVEACAGTWEEMPAGTFEGTQVRALLLTISA